MMRLSIEQVVAIHSQLILETGGTNGVRDFGLLESALLSPFQTFSCEELYPSVQQKAAQMCHALIGNHPFVDGNKRTGVHVMLVFLAINNIELDYSQDELVQLGLDAAKGLLKAENIVQWIVEHDK